MSGVRNCGGCGQSIGERPSALVSGSIWHEACVKCADCACELNDRCFGWDGRLYCKIHFCSRLSNKCAMCGQGFAYDDLTRKMKGSLYHETCVTCAICCKQLATGEVLYFDSDGAMYCAAHANSPSMHGELEGAEKPQELPRGLEIERRLPHYVRHPPFVQTFINNVTHVSVACFGSPWAMPSQYPRSGIGFHTGGGVCATEKEKKVRRSRKMLNKDQKRVLEEAFNVNPRPNRETWALLATQTGLTYRKTQVWFQNRRTKLRRAAKKAAADVTAIQEAAIQGDA